MDSNQTKQIEKVKNEITLNFSLIKKTANTVIADEKQYSKAGEIIVTLKKTLKDIEAKRKTFTEPLNGVIKSINSEFKAMAEPIEQLISDINSGMVKFFKEQEAKRILEEKKRIEMEEKLKKEMEEKLKKQKNEVKQQEIMLQTQNKIENIQTEKTIEKSIETKSGNKVSMMKIRKFEVIDTSKIPVEYMIPDMVKIGKMVKAGINEIAGIRIYEDFTSSVR